jgi:hypothetical protein
VAVAVLLPLTRGFAPATIIGTLCNKCPSHMALRASVEMDDALPRGAMRVLDSVRHSITDDQQLLLETYLRSVQMAREVAAREVELGKYRLESAMGQLLRLKGLLHMRGVLEYVEQHYKQQHLSTREKREVMWEKVLQQHPSLEQCIVRKTGWRSGVITNRISSLYDTLNKHCHTAYTPEEWTLRDAIVITDTHQAALLDCHVLVCICEHFGIPYELQLSDVAADIENDVAPSE